MEKRSAVRSEDAFLREARRRKLVIRSSDAGKYLVATDDSGDQVWGVFEKRVGVGTFWSHPQFNMLYSASLNATEAERARAELMRRSYNGTDKSIRTTFFKGKNTTGVPNGWEDWPSSVQTVSLDKLAATQMDVDIAGVERYIAQDGDLPDVVFYAGQLLVADGHHRIAANILGGKKSMRVRLYNRGG